MGAVPWFVLLLVTVFGLAVGSFLNVVIYRVPRGESIARPGSHCPSCTAPIRARHNVPVFGWLLLRGRCADCRAPISVRYPAVELGTAVLMVAITLRFGVTLELPAFLLFGALAIALALIDVDLRRLPDSIVLPAYVLAGLMLVPAAAPSDDWRQILRSFAGMTVLAAVYAVLRVLRPKAFTVSDIKLAGLLGIFLGWSSWTAVAAGAAIGLLMGAGVGVAAATRHRGAAVAVAQGSCLITGAAVALFATVPLSAWYAFVPGAS